MSDLGFAAVIASHPLKAGALYKGVPAPGVFKVTTAKLYDLDGKYIFNKTYTFTFLTSSLPAISDKHNVYITINNLSYRILNFTPENPWITVLDLEEKQ